MIVLVTVHLVGGRKIKLYGDAGSDHAAVVASLARGIGPDAPGVTGTNRRGNTVLIPPTSVDWIEVHRAG